MIAAAARRLTGFGFALIGAPLLSLALPPQQLVVTVLLLQVFMGVPSAFEFRKELDWPVLWQLALGGILTSPVGMLVLIYADPDIVLFTMGVCVIAAATILGIMPHMIKIRTSRGANVACGMLAGVMSSSVGMPGPPIAIYFMGQQAMPVNIRRAMLITTFSLLACVSLAIAVPSGQVSSDSFWLSVILLGPALIGGHLGEFLHKKLNKKWVERFALSLVFLSGLLCLVRAV
jgi:uncharacterized membrane protein YfcA